MRDLTKSLGALLIAFPLVLTGCDSGTDASKNASKAGDELAKPSAAQERKTKSETKKVQENQKPTGTGLVD